MNAHDSLDASTLAGPSAVVSGRLKIPDADRLALVLAWSGETTAELVRRLLLAHLDALDASTPAAS